jgi:hypothetical protein
MLVASPIPRRAAQQAKEFFGNLLKMLQQKVHQSQMAQVVRSGTAIVATAREPATNGRQRTRANGSNEFISDLPFGIELFRCHSQLAMAVEFN